MRGRKRKDDSGMHPKAITLPVAGTGRSLLASRIDRLPKRWRSLSSVATLLFICSGPALADRWIDVVAAGAHYDNLTRAADRADRRADRVAALGVTGDLTHAHRAEVAWTVTLKPEIRVRRAPVAGHGNHY